MSVPSLLAYAGIYRAKLSRNSDIPLSELTPIEELCSDSLKTEQPFFVAQKALGTILTSFSGSFINEEERLHDVEKQYIGLQAALRESRKLDFQCLAAEHFKSAEYPLRVGSVWSSEEKAANPLSPHGLFIQFPTASFCTFCHDRAENNITGEVVCPSTGPCPFADEVYYSFCRDCIPFSAHGCSQLYGFAIILNGLLFEKTSSGDASECSGDHVVMCMLSFLPEFLFVREIVINSASYLCELSQENLCKNTGPLNNDELFRKHFQVLSSMVSEKSALRATFPGNRIENAFFSSRYLALQRSAAMLFEMIDTPLSILLQSFSNDAIRLLHTLLLSESRIIFLGCSPQHASACAVSAPSIVSPLKWVAPLIPYLPVEMIKGSRLLEALFSPSIGHENCRSRQEGDIIPSLCSEANGFIIGCMGDLIPPLILCWSALAAANGGISASTQVWVADARTGHIGRLPVECPWNTSSGISCCDQLPTSIALVPASDKLQKKCVAALNDCQRHDFRRNVAYFSQLRKTSQQIKAHNSFMQKLLGEEVEKNYVQPNYKVGRLEFLEADSVPRIPNISKTLLVEVHAAFFEFNTHRICGEYRKGLKLPQPGWINQFSFNACSFLESQLHSNELAKTVEGTHMFKQFFGAIMNFEVYGVKNVLGGTKSASGATCSSKSSGNATSKPPLHPWGHSPVFLAELCLFYSRARNRFPELFPDFSSVNLSKYCVDQVNALLAPSESVRKGELSFQGDNSKIMNTIVSLAGTVSDGSPESKGTMQKFFSKASKAVKKLQNGETHFIYVLPYLQSFISFMCSPPTSNINKIIESISDTERNEGSSSTSIPTPSSLLGMEYKFPEVLSKKSPNAPCKPNGLSGLPYRLPLDMIQNFSDYHSLLNPFEHSPYMCSNTLEEVRLLLKPQKMESQTHNCYKHLCEFSSLFPFSQRLWESITTFRHIIESSPSDITERSHHAASMSSNESQTVRVSLSPQKKENAIALFPAEKDSVPSHIPSSAEFTETPTPEDKLPELRPSLSDLFDGPLPAVIPTAADNNDDMMQDGFSSGVPEDFFSRNPQEEAFSNS